MPQIIYKLLLLRFVVSRQFRKPFIRDPSGNAVLIQRLKDCGQLRDPLLCGIQLPASGGVLLFAAVLVLLNQELAEPGLMLGGIAGDPADVLGHTGGQKVGTDEMRCAVRCPLLVAAADIAVLFPLVRLIPLLVKHAAAVRAEQQAGEQADFPVAVGAFPLLAQLLYPFPCIAVKDRLVGVLKDSLFLFRGTGCFFLNMSGQDGRTLCKTLQMGMQMMGPYMLHSSFMSLFRLFCLSGEI